MVLDLIVAVAVLGTAIFGAQSGALEQLFRLGAGVACAVLGRPIGAWLAGPLAAKTGWPPSLAGMVASSLAFVALFVLFRIAAKALAWSLTRDGEVKAIDRGAGAFVGAARALFFAWVLLSALVMAEKPAERLGLKLDARSSLFATLTRKVNFFQAVPIPGLPVIPT